MRNLRNPQLERGEVRIEDIKLNHKCRDDMPTLLSGLQYLYSQEALRDRLFALLDEFILLGINKKVGRPGMAMWSILVMGVVKQGLGCDFDHLHDLVNEHKTLRNFLGHADYRGGELDCSSPPAQIRTCALTHPAPTYLDEGFLMRVPTLHCVQAHEGPALENLPRTKARGSW